MLSAPPKAQKSRKQSMESAEKLDMSLIAAKVMELHTPTNSDAMHRRPGSIAIADAFSAVESPGPNAVGSGKRGSTASRAPLPPSGLKPVFMHGKMFYYIGCKPIKSEDWRAAYVSLNGNKLSGAPANLDSNSNPVSPSANSKYDLNKQQSLFDWPVCTNCRVGKAEDISKKGDRTKWGFVFSVECDFKEDESKKEIYFVAETDQIGADWVHAVYDARYLTTVSQSELASPSWLQEDQPTDKSLLDEN